MRKARAEIIKPGKLPSCLRRPDDAEIIRAADEVCRRDFLSFASWCFNELTPGIALLPNWHLEALAFRLEQVRRGEIKRLMINLPPRYGKSIFTSITLPAFVLGLGRVKTLCRRDPG